MPLHLGHTIANNIALQNTGIDVIYDFDWSTFETTFNMKLGSTKKTYGIAVYTGVRYLIQNQTNLDPNVLNWQWLMSHGWIDSYTRLNLTAVSAKNVYVRFYTDLKRKLGLELFL